MNFKTFILLKANLSENVVRTIVTVHYILNDDSFLVCFIIKHTDQTNKNLISALLYVFGWASLIIFQMAN